MGNNDVVKNNSSIKTTYLSNNG